MGWFPGVLDGSGVFTFSFTPAIDVPALTGIPVYSQLAVLDAGANRYRLSNGDIEFYRD